MLSDSREAGYLVNKNHHLPGIPSVQEAADKDISLGDMQAEVLAKIDELTLHMIDEENRNRQL